MQSSTMTSATSSAVTARDNAAVTRRSTSSRARACSTAAPIARSPSNRRAFSIARPARRPMSSANASIPAS